MSIEVKNIHKFYGDQQALNDLSFSIKKGEIVGFLGPNGAGKSTMMRILTGFITDFEGDVFICGKNIRTETLEAQKLIGYLPEHNPLYVNMYVREYLQFCARIHKFPKKEIEQLIEKVGLTPEANKKISTLSKGYRQRVGLAAALLHEPEILILDEPTTGLDPNQLVEIRALIKEVGKNTTVLFSTHIMQEVEAVCDRVLVLKKGVLVADKQLENLRSTSEQVLEVQFDTRIEAEFVNRLPKLKKAQGFKDNNWLLTFDTKEDMRPKVFDFAYDNGMKILQMNTKNQALETVFKELTS